MKCDDLVFDVGMHRGEDTEHYLRQGFRVVAVEANPALVDAATQRFATAIASGRLTIVGAAVAEEPGTIQLAVFDEHTVWSSTDRAFIARNVALGQRYRSVEVPAVRFVDLLAEHGVPRYLKVDIEGFDMLCVRALHEVAERPDYLSIESAVTSPRSGVAFEAVFDELAELWTLGYRAFKFVDQARVATEPGSSGPFGDESAGRWARIGPTLAQAASLRMQYEMTGYGTRWGNSRVGRAYSNFRNNVLHRPLGWYDLHVKLTSA
ncbi:MAG: FkbM family methyltransferase [Chloroflexi bacterium]|nr:FkbM family methyltransferase [Chloroflexota bacterium]